MKELARLRNENASLQKQLQEARAKEFEPIEGTPVVFSESPQALRSRVETFIDALDRYIEAAENDTDPLHTPAESGG